MSTPEEKTRQNRKRIAAILFAAAVLVAIGVVLYLKYRTKTCTKTADCGDSKLKCLQKKCVPTGAAAFELQKNTDYNNDAAAPRPFGTNNESETTLQACYTQCENEAKCFGFGVERRDDLAAKGQVKCWFKNTKKSTFKYDKPNADYYVKK